MLDEVCFTKATGNLRSGCGQYEMFKEDYFTAVNT